jgi:hypothetical protein
MEVLFHLCLIGLFCFFGGWMGFIAYLLLMLVVK